MLSLVGSLGGRSLDLLYSSDDFQGGENQDAGAPDWLCLQGKQEPAEEEDHQHKRRDGSPGQGLSMSGRE